MDRDCRFIVQSQTLVNGSKERIGEFESGVKEHAIQEVAREHDIVVTE
jgi:hypothetical protein